MMPLAVDTNVLFSIFLNDRVADKFLELLENHRSSRFVINQIIYLELLTFFLNENVLQKKLEDSEIEFLDVPVSNKRLLIQSWKKYLSKKTYHCPACGGMTELLCGKCGKKVEMRQRMLPDFYIGEFALSHCSGIMTRDAAFYRHYFKDLTVITI
jgi:predicted nucleic acid-binding protein